MPGIFRGLHYDQPAPGQYDAPMAGNPRHPAMNEAPRSLPGTELTVEIGRGRRGQKDVEE